jgi:ergothioneine biosynthesis protein EgtB
MNVKMELQSPVTGAASASPPGQRYRAVRRFSESIAKPLSPEDCAIQSMPDASPIKWHLAHTTWFFETFLLREQQGYREFNPRFTDLYNSYYNAIGKQFPRPQRGLLSRPALAEIFEYRQHVDQYLEGHLASDQEIDPSWRRILEIGLQHEQQHQELMLTDVKHLLSLNPLDGVYQNGRFVSSRETRSGEIKWMSFEEGIYEVGHRDNGFCFDNELPRHRVFLNRFELSSQLVTCGEYLEFIEDQGYTRPELWLSLGWQAVCDRQWTAPLYWQKVAGRWHEFTLAGQREVDLSQPVCHLSYFEAEAFARWKGARLPTEFEWELAASQSNPITGNFADTLFKSGLAFQPCLETGIEESLFGNVWQWTSSPYVAYPGYAPPDGALGEYNGKFMCNQIVLRGGSCATHSTHMRASYRNFFPPDARWQFSGIRLARSCSPMERGYGRNADENPARRG